MVLFQYTMSELRERFVRARFAEEGFFGREDIEKWLARQRKAGSPDVRQWRALIRSRHQMWWWGFPSEIPDNFLTSTVVRPLLFGVGCPSDASEEVKSIFSQLHDVFFELISAKHSFYINSRCVILRIPCGHENFRLLVVEPTAVAVPALVGSNSTFRFRKIERSDVADVLLTEWERWTIFAERARMVLCDALTIRVVRDSARTDFDRAVAVTEDGTKIVHATEVFVFDGKECRRYAPEDFFEQKILRTLDLRRMTMKDATDDELKQYLTTERGQWLFIDDTKDRRIFVTHKDFCPDPLPAISEPAKA